MPTKCWKAECTLPHHDRKGAQTGNWNSKPWDTAKQNALSIGKHYGAAHSDISFDEYKTHVTAWNSRGNQISVDEVYEVAGFKPKKKKKQKAARSALIPTLPTPPAVAAPVTQVAQLPLKKGRTSLAADKVARIVELAQQGATAPAIAKEMGVHKSTVYAYTSGKKNGAGRPKRKYTRRAKIEEVTPTGAEASETPQVELGPPVIHCPKCGDKILRYDISRDLIRKLGVRQ